MENDKIREKIEELRFSLINYIRNFYNDDIISEKERIEIDLTKIYRFGLIDFVEFIHEHPKEGLEFIKECYREAYYSLKNEYPKKIVYLSGNLFVEDKDGVKILHDFIKRKVDLPVGGEITIKKTHQLNSDLEETLKNENPENLKIYFEVITAKFADGSKVECGIF